VLAERRIPVAAHGRVEHASHVHPVLHAVTRHRHVHVGQVEPPWSARRLHMVAYGEVPIAVRIAARRRNMRRVDNVVIDKLELVGC
jgi:hypothetical protein